MAAAAAAAEIPETLSSTENVILMERIVSEFTINGVGELDHLHKPIEHLEEPDYNRVEGGQREGESFFQSPSLANECVVEEVKLQKDGQSEAVEKIESDTKLLKDRNEGVGIGGKTDAEEQNQEEAEDKLKLSALTEEETPMVIKEDSLLPKEIDDKSLDANAISKDSGVQNFTLIQDEEQVESRAVEVEAEVARFEPLEKVSEDTEATKELETLNKDKTEAIREIDFAEDPTIEEGHQLIQADEEIETVGVKETQCEDDLETDIATEIVLEDHASIEKVNQTGEGDDEISDNKAEQPTAALDVSGGEQGGALEDKQKEEPEEVNDEQGQQVHDDQSLLKVIEDHESLNKESTETTQREACILQKSENEIEIAENVSIGDVTQDDEEGLTETKEDLKEDENPELEVTEISSEVKMDSEEVYGSALEKVSVVNEGAEEQTQDKTNLSAVIEEETEDKSIDTNAIREDGGEKQDHPSIQEAEQLTVAVEDAKPEKSKDDTVEAIEIALKDDTEAEESTGVLAEHASMEKENEVNRISDGDKEIEDKEPSSSSAVLQTPNECRVEETTTAHTEQSEVNSSVEIAEPSVPRDAAEASTPPLPLELIERSSSVAVAESEVAEIVEGEVESNSYLNEEKEIPEIGDSADETVLPASEACEVPESGVKAKEYLEEASYVEEVEVNGNTQAEIEEANSGTQEKESETREVVSSEIEVPEIHIKSEDAEGKDKVEEPEKQPASIGAAKDSICDDISNERVNEEQGSAETSGEVQRQVVEEIVHAEEIHVESASIPETEDQNEDPAATVLEGITEKDVDAEVQNQEEAEDKLILDAAIEEETPMVSQEDSLWPKETEDKLMDADAKSEDAGGQNFTLIQDEEQVESRAVKMEVEVASFEPLEQVSEDAEATKEPEILIKDQTEAVREITFAEDPKTEEGRQLIQEADEENETAGVKETQCEDDLEADKSTKVVLEDYASIEKVNQTGDGDKEITDNKAEQPTAALDVEVEQGGALEDKQKEEPEVNDERGEQVDEPIHDDQSSLKVIEEQESLSKETTETTETEACTLQKSEKEIEVADSVSIVAVTQDEGEGLADTKEDQKVAEEEVENPEIAVVEISSVKVESEEVNEDAKDQNQGETEDKPNLGAVIEEETEIVSKEGSLQSKETEDKSTDANAITISEDGGEEQGHSSIQEAEQLTVALEDAKLEKYEENETVEANETSKDDLEEESTYLKENEVNRIGDGDKETADKEPSAALDAEGDVSGGEQGGSLEDIQKEEVSSSVELQTQNEYQVEEINTASTEQIAEPSVPSDVAEASTPPLPLELIESSSSVVVAESEMAEAVEEEVESKAYLSEDKETPTIGDSADETVLHATEACEVPEFGVKAKECPEEASYVEAEVNGNTQADNEEAISETQEKESETKEVVSSEIEVPQIHIKSEDAEVKDNIEEPEQQPAASVGAAKDSIFDDISNEGVNEEQGSAETSGEFKEEVIEEVGQVEKIHEGSASIPETENHATIAESIIENDVAVESEETENLELSSEAGVKEVCIEKEEQQRSVDFEVDEKKPEDEALESPVQDCNTSENEPMPNEITTQEEQSASEQVQDVEMQNVGEVNELIHDGNSTEQKVDEYVDEIQVEGGDAKDIHETLAQHEESDCVIISSEDNEAAANGNIDIEETITVQEKDASVEVNGQIRTENETAPSRTQEKESEITEDVPSEIEVNIKSEESIDELKMEEPEKQPESTDAANRSICDIISNEGVSGEQGNAETLIEERDAGLPLVDNTEANDAEETEVNNLESKEPPVGGGESNPTDIERSKMQMQDSYSTAQTEDAGEATKEVIMEENASYDTIGSEDTEGKDLGAEVVEVLAEQPTEEPASSESIQECEEVSNEKPISDTQHKEDVSIGETTSGLDFPSVDLGDQIDETEPTLSTELIEDSASIVEDITKEAVTVESEESEKHELSSATEGAQDIQCEVGELKKSEDEEIELIQNVITTQEGTEKDASVVLKEDFQEETPTTIQEIVEESAKECLVEPPEVNGHTESGNEGVATQGKESEIIGLSSEDVDDEQKNEEPEKQPKSTDDSICDHISDEGVNDEQESVETSEEVEERVVEKQNTSEENEIGKTEEIQQTSDAHVTERSCDKETPVIKEDISTEEEITVADVKEETPIEEVHIVQGQVDESGNVKLVGDEEAGEDEITKAEEEPEKHVSSGETTSGSGFPSVELGDQIDRTEPTVATEQIEDSATIVGNTTKEAVTVVSEESEKHELSSAADKEEVFLEKEEAQQSEANEGAQDIQCEVGELKESEDVQKELIKNVINTNEGKDGSEQVPNAEKQSVSEVNEVVQDEIPAEQVDEEAAKDEEDTKRNVEGDETIIVQENDASVLCKEDVEEQTSTTIQENVGEIESETIEDCSPEIEVPEIHKESEDDGSKFEEPEKEPKNTDDSICDHISNEGVNDESAKTSEAVKEQVFEEVVEKQNINEESEINQLDGIEKVDEHESLKLEDDSNTEQIDQTLVEHVMVSEVADVNEETAIDEVHIVQGEVNESGNVKPERDEAEKDEITKGDVEIGEQQEIVTKTDKSIISPEEVHDEYIESYKTLEGCDTKPIYETSVQQVTSDKEAEFEEHGERDSVIPEATSETEPSAIKLEETEVTEDEEISSSIERADEAVKEVISEIALSESQPDKEIKETEASSHVTFETIKEETETKESITEAEDSETRNLKIQDEAETQFETVIEKIEPVQDGNSHEEVVNGHEVVESESIILESGRADDTNEVSIVILSGRADDTKEAATTSESSTVKEAGDQSSAEIVTLIEREIESPEAHIDNSTDSGVASCVTTELIREGGDETEEAATKSESSTAELNKEEGMSSILQEKGAEEHVDEETAEEAHIIESETPLEEEIEFPGKASSVALETRALTSEVNHVDSEATNLNLEEATILDVTEADEKQITYEEEKGIVSGGCIEAEDAREHITEGGDENETREAEIVSTVTIESTEITSEVKPEIEKEEPDSKPENTGLQNLNHEEVTAVGDVKLSSMEAEGPVSGEYKEAEEDSREGDDETKETVSLTFEAREIISEAEPKAENKPSSESEINSLNLEEVTAADAKQSEHVIDTNEEVHETADMIKEATQETEVDDKKPFEEVRRASEATQGVRFTEEEEKYENEVTKQPTEKDVDAAKEIYETITEERESSTAFTSTVQSEDIDSSKEVAEERDSSYDKSLGVEVVDEAEAKLNEVASEKGSELTSKEEADKGGLQDYAPKDAVISDGGTQIVYEDHKITPDVKSEVQSRDISTGLEFDEGENKPAPENIDVHPKEVDVSFNNETSSEAVTLTGVAVARNIDTSYVMIDAEVTDTKSRVIDDTSLDAATDRVDLSLSDLLHKARDQNQKVATPLTEEKGNVGSTLELHNEEEADAHEAKTDEERDEAEVMVESSKDIDVKTPKKHSNILSGVSSKVKHSISKVKKAITGKSKTKVPKMNEALPAS